MKKIQSHGPYYIAGWSLGGVIAFEMAAQLEQKNDEIAFLALIDSPPPHKNLGEEATEFNLESELNFVKDYIPEFEVKEKFSNVPELSSLWLSILDYLEASNYDVGLIKNELARFGGLVLPNYQQLELKESIYYLNLGRTFRHARALYEPSVKVQTPVYYISASQSKEIEKELWQKYSNGGIYYYETPGDHFSILQMPGVIDLSLLFSEILRFRQLG
jgi:thioesterase domain-containing protein